MLGTVGRSRLEVRMGIRDVPAAVVGEVELGGSPPVDPALAGSERIANPASGLGDPLGHVDPEVAVDDRPVLDLVAEASVRVDRQVATGAPGVRLRFGSLGPGELSTHLCRVVLDAVVAADQLEADHLAVAFAGGGGGIVRIVRVAVAVVVDAVRVAVLGRTLPAPRGVGVAEEVGVTVALTGVVDGRTDVRPVLAARLLEGDIAAELAGVDVAGADGAGLGVELAELHLRAVVVAQALVEVHVDRGHGPRDGDRVVEDDPTRVVDFVTAGVEGEGGEQGEQGGEGEQHALHESLRDSRLNSLSVVVPFQRSIDKFKLIEVTG